MLGRAIYESLREKERMSPAVGDVIAFSSTLFYNPTIAVVMVVINRVVISGNLKSGYLRPLFKVTSGAVSMNAGIYSALAVFPSFGDISVALYTSEMVMYTALPPAFSAV